MASRTAYSAGAYSAREAGGIAILRELLDIQPGITAVIGAGGKTTLVRALAEELTGCEQRANDASSMPAACNEPKGEASTSPARPKANGIALAHAKPAASPHTPEPFGAALARPIRAIVATSTKMFAPDWCPVLLDASLDEVRAALSESPVVCVGSIHEPTGKLAAPTLAFPDLAQLADYVLVEADGAKMLPLKAHAEHEPAIPDGARRVVCVAGIDGVGKPVSQVCHRTDAFARLAGTSPNAAVTPEAIAAVLEAEALHDVVLINKVHTAADWQAAERIAALLGAPVVAGSLWKEEFRCLR